MLWLVDLSFADFDQDEIAAQVQEGSKIFGIDVGIRSRQMMMHDI